MSRKDMRFIKRRRRREILGELCVNPREILRMLLLPMLSNAHGPGNQELVATKIAQAYRSAITAKGIFYLGERVLPQTWIKRAIVNRSDKRGQGLQGHIIGHRHVSTAPAPHAP